MKRKTGKKLLSLLTAGMMLTAAVPAVSHAADDLIKNGTFESGKSGWDMYKESGGSAVLTTENGKLALQISALGKVTYAVQMYYDIIPVYQNAVYHLHYEISSTEPRFVEGMLQQNGGTYQAYTWKGLNLTAEPLIVDYDFTMEYESDIMAKLVFNCGDQGEDVPPHTIYLDNVSLVPVDESGADKDAVLGYQAPILTDQVGFRPGDRKTAVIRDDSAPDGFEVVNAETKEVVFRGALSAGVANSSANETDRTADFSEVREPGRYYITCGSLDPSYEFVIAGEPYAKLLDESVRMLCLQRCGCAVEDAKFSHPACHNTMAAVYGTNEKIDVSGGWHDAGDYGRYVVPAAKAVADLLYAYQANPTLFSDSIGIPESGNGVPDILDETRFELEWMLKMQAASGGVYHKVTCESFPGYVMPQEETEPLIVTPVSTNATADFCASMAMAAEFYAGVDADFADKCLSAAKRAWAFLEQNPNFIYTNPADITTGDYGDRTDRDERYWAAAQMYRATGDSSCLTALESMSVSSGLDWSTVGDYGNIALVTMQGIDKTLSVYTAAEKKILSQADSMKTVTNNSPYGSPIVKYNWGSNMTIANAGVIMGLAYQLSGDGSYLSAANDVLHYLLGKNPLGTCFVTGFGTVSPEHPHHRPSMNVGQAMPGMLVGGVNSSLEDSAAKAYCANVPAAKCYIDNSESYSTNEITIYWNSPLTYLLSLTEAKTGDEKQTVAGDVNGDGEFSVADAVALQRWLLGIDTALADWKAADLNGDSKLNAIDFTLMKRALLDQ